MLAQLMYVENVVAADILTNVLGAYSRHMFVSLVPALSPLEFGMYSFFCISFSLF